MVAQEIRTREWKRKLKIPSGIKYCRQIHFVGFFSSFVSLLTVADMIWENLGKKKHF